MYKTIFVEHRTKFPIFYRGMIFLGEWANILLLDFRAGLPFRKLVNIVIILLVQYFSDLNFLPCINSCITPRPAHKPA